MRLAGAVVVPFSTVPEPTSLASVIVLPFNCRREDAAKSTLPLVGLLTVLFPRAELSPSVTVPLEMNSVPE